MTAIFLVIIHVTGSMVSIHMPSQEACEAAAKQINFRLVPGSAKIATAYCIAGKES